MFTRAVTLSLLNISSALTRNYFSQACKRYYEDLDDGVGDRRGNFVDNTVRKLGEHVLITTHIAHNKVA